MLYVSFLKNLRETSIDECKTLTVFFLSFSGEAPPVQVLPKNLFHTRRPAEPHEDPLPGFCLLKNRRQTRKSGKIFFRNFLIKTFPDGGNLCFSEQLKTTAELRNFSLKSDIYYSYLLQKRNNKVISQTLI